MKPILYELKLAIGVILTGYGLYSIHPGLFFTIVGLLTVHSGLNDFYAHRFGRKENK